MTGKVNYMLIFSCSPDLWPKSVHSMILIHYGISNLLKDFNRHWSV